MSATSHPSTPPPGGVEQAHVIDLVTHDPRTDVVTLTMVERRPWNDGEEQLFQLQEKCNAYVSFALDGEMAEAYPALMGKSLRLRLECIERPAGPVLEFLAAVREQVAFQGLDVEVVVTGGSCGSECGCS